MKEMEKAMVLMGLSLAFMGYIFLVGDADRILILIFAGLMVLLAIMLVFKDKFPSGLRRHLTDISRGLDVGWLALGLGFLGTGIECFEIQDQIRSAPLVWLGAAFIVVSALCISRSVGTSANRILEQNPKALIIIGCSFLIGGLIWFVMNWEALNTDTLLGKLNAYASQLYLVCVGILLIYFGWRRNKKPTSPGTKQVKKALPKQNYQS